MINPKHKIIFEGAELSGKSYLMSQIFNVLEKKYYSGGRIMDGCHWFNTDVGVFGGKYGKVTLEKYLELMEEMGDANLMLEKFHLTEKVYQKLYNNNDFDFSYIEDRLKKINTKIILITFDENEDLIKHRLKHRLELYPHYSKIAQKPEQYIRQQQLYKEFIKQSKLEYMTVDASVLPNEKIVKDILDFLKE